MSGIVDLSLPHIRPFIDRARIDCDKIFDYECPRKWGALEDTGSGTVRHCLECRQQVYLVTTPAELTERAERGECIAVILPEEIPTSPYDVDVEDGGQERRPMMMLGRPALPPPPGDE